MIELLAPGGNINNVKLAFATGADAVYIGMKQFSARNKCDNFEYSQLEEIMLIAKLQNKKVFVALNTIIKNSELDDFFEAVKICEKLNVDGLILQDLFLGKFLKDNGCTIPLHASTQSGVCSVDSAILCEKFGFDRVILSRETKIDEIRKIRNATNLEIEYFIQGALCVCFSGNCYFSSVIDGNSGNRGKCFQPCRKKYILRGKNINREGYLISPKDLCLDSHIEKLIQAGVCSFKIEGRLRRSEYVGSSVAHYRSIIDGVKLKDSKRDLSVAFNRGNYTSGYINTRKSMVIAPDIQNHIGIEIGKVTKQTGKNTYFVKSKYVPNIGDGFKILYNGKEIGGVEHQKGLKSTADGFEIFSNLAIVGSMINLTTDKKLDEKYSNFDFKIPLKLRYTIKINKPIELKYEVANISYNYISDTIASPALNAPLSKEKLEKSLLKFGDTLFVCDDISGELEHGVFLGVSQINDVRRQSVEAFFEHLKCKLQNNDNIQYNYSFNIENISDKSQKAVIFDEYSVPNEYCDIAIYKPTIYEFDHHILKDVKSGEIYLYLPCFIDSEDTAVIKYIVKKYNFAGLYIENYAGIEIANSLGVKIFIGEKLNISNNLSYKIARNFANDICFSKELTISEISAPNAYILSYGGFEIMTFAHCPLIANDICTCKNCKYSNGIKYIDDNNREFQLKRLKINECQFNLYYNEGIDARELTKEFNQLHDITISNDSYRFGNLQRGIK